MESQKTINFPEKAPDNKDLPKKKVNKKRNNKEIKIEPILSISFNHDSIVQIIEFRKIVSFLDKTFDNKNLPKFVTKKWIEFYDQSQGNYNVNKEIRIKTSMLRSDLCDFMYILLLKEILLLLKKHLLLMTLMHLIIQ